jgi:predicted RNA-binding protein with TRAM domain
MEISDQLRSLFSATVEAQDDSYVVEVPKQEIRLGAIQEDGRYQVAILSSPSTNGATDTDDATDTDTEPERERGPPNLPVTEGEQRTVEIESLGDQGDGIARVERGFVVIVPDTEQGERVTIEIADVTENVAFAEVIERVSYYD